MSTLKFSRWKNIDCLNCKRRTGAYRKYSFVKPIISISIFACAMIASISLFVAFGILAGIGPLFAALIGEPLSIAWFMSRKKKRNIFRCHLCGSTIEVDPTSITYLDEFTGEDKSTENKKW